LKKLKHTTSVRDYVKQFSSLILDIKDMSKADKLYNFMYGLQVWAQLEVRRQGVCDLPTAMTTADALMDFRQSREDGEQRKPKPKDKSKKKEWDGKKSQPKSKPNNKGKSNATEKQPYRSNIGCFICNEPHKAKDCPKKEKLNAIATTGVEQKNEDGDTQVRMNHLQIQLNALKSEASSELLYVPIKANSQSASTMLDTMATHNFVAAHMVEMSGLKESNYPNQLKAVNSEAQPVAGVAHAVSLKVGDWSRKATFLVPMPILGSLLIMDEEQPCFA
jgi:hypothetical protein